MPNETTPTQRLASVLLGQDLADFVSTRRDMDPPRSWRLIARDLFQATKGQIDVTPTTVSNWFGGDSATTHARTCSYCGGVALPPNVIVDTETPERAWCSEDHREAEQERAAEFIAS